jgi:hypothetical protein
VALRKYDTKGIFCLEGDWDIDLRKHYSVEPVLRLLKDAEGVSFIHRRLGTIPELEYYLKKWTLKRYAHYPILWLSFHGDPEVIWMTKSLDVRKSLTLEQLAEILAGKCEGRIIHLGSCATMQTHGARINTFVRETGAMAVCGYSEYVDWTISTAFEIILFSRMQWRAFSRRGALYMLRDLQDAAPGLAKQLGFRMIVRPTNSH